MRAVKHDSISFSDNADAVFRAALGVVQNTKAAQLLAVHNEGRKLVVRENTAMGSNAKFHQVWVADQGQGAQLHIAVGTDPRTSGAFMDGFFNNRSLQKYVEKVRGVVDGSASAATTPVSNHYLQKDTEVPWEDPEQDPEIEVGGNVRAAFGL